MNRRLIVSVTLGSALVLCVEIARAQQAPSSPPPQAEMMQAGPEGDFIPPPFGERMELLGFGGMRGGKIVTGAPFSAVAASETTQTLADGNHISRKTQSNLYRDSQGRVRREITLLVGFGPLAASGQPKSFVVINDPVAGVTYLLHPDQKTAEKIAKPFAKMGGAEREAMRNNRSAREQQEIANGTLRQEDLGTQTIGGVSAQGTRITRTIPAGQMGNEKPITIVNERWYSNDLQTVVMSKRSDPWSGETTYTLTNINRTEPDASHFTVPSDYSVTQGRQGMPRMRHNQAPPPGDD